MNTQQAYNTWAQQYDTNQNRTRDLEAQALRTVLASLSFGRCLEIGCGTGKNTSFLAQKAQEVTAVDLSEEMLAKAKEKITAPHVQFTQADITKDWTFGNGLYDLVTFSLVLEHIQQLDHIFEQASQSLLPGGHVYLGELHPFKQYTGTKARFDTEAGRQEVECFVHPVSEFTQTAKRHGLNLVDLNEFFDDGNTTSPPRILTLLFQKR
ncbi:class I SAM-dependent DNA methyltransferase [Rufibacter latericius]|uniref:Class I SAM-dependent methyltransferase n=1 Tax=Rufibacter latericius TaxID=2487040 RepID=A0A3M9MAW8_9BACT|nr:class I SAM-dependent methyltransferase [Rufibacter latericius]RNI22013.1 class I SAM-dependent methyltransferase [Rufibacter latericius]